MEVNHDDDPRYIELQQVINRLQQLIDQEKQSISEARQSNAMLRFRLETAENAQKASDQALLALRTLSDSSQQIIEASHDAVSILLKKIVNSEESIRQKDASLKMLATMAAVNQENLKASAAALAALTDLAFTDPLTGLANRRLLDDRIVQAIHANKRWDAYSAAIFFDLDKFKALNDQFGHDVGDQLLIAVAKRLKSFVREMDTVARYGGDEFVVILSGLIGNLPDAQHQVRDIAEKILKFLAEPYQITLKPGKAAQDCIDYQCSASMGVAMFGGELDDHHTILDWADEAMYWAKSEGGNTLRFYSAENSIEQTLLGLYALATAHDIETANHGIRTREYVKALALFAKQMDLYPEQLTDQLIDRMYKTCQLHDIGKTKIAYEIIHKQQKLNPVEWAEMQTHAIISESILSEAKRQNAALEDFLNTAIHIAGGHHEHWDGSGYPRGLLGEAIPLEGRIMAIADVYDALISSRPYKQAWSHEAACELIISQGGSKFDPALIEAFAHVQANFQLIAEHYSD